MDKFTVRNSSGEVDVAASATAYAEALTAWKTDHEMSSEKIEAAVDAVFSRFPGKRLPMPALLSLSVAELDATPEQHKTLTARVHAYVKGQTGLGKIAIVKGKGGGCEKVSA